MTGLVGKFLNDVAGGFFGNDYLRDFTHASKIFRSGFYQNSPKFKFLFHVYFTINEEAKVPLPQVTGLRENISVLVKSVRLPNYTFQTTDLNQYNRKRIVQTKIKYDPVEIAFHDDNNNLINSLWYRYYTYYYADGTKPKVFFQGKRGGQPASTQYGGGVTAPANGANYNVRNLYDNDYTESDNWGYQGENQFLVDPAGRKVPFFKNITIFGLTQHKFIAYTLVNPIITRFGHDTYNYDEGGVMQNTMTLDYETVVYNQGNIDGKTPSNIITDFGEEPNYDKKLSPISEPGSNSNILGPNGIIESAGGAITDIFGGGDIIGGIRTAGRVVNGVKNINLKSSLKAEIGQAINNALTNSSNPTRAKFLDIPIAQATPSNEGTAGAPPQARQQPDQITSVGTGAFAPTDAGLSPQFAGQQNNVG